MIIDLSSAYHYGHIRTETIDNDCHPSQGDKEDHVVKSN
jgi:hypothetical protein